MNSISRFSIVKRSTRILVAAISCAVIACAPRGESRTLEEVFTQQRTAYLEKSRATTVAADVGDKLKKISGTLDVMAGVTPDGGTSVSAAADDLQSLSTKCNYTVRPSLAELVEQMRGLEKEGRKLSPGAPEPKLIAARVYTLLSSELTTSKFGIS